MEFWSEGLGKRNLIMGLDRAEVGMEKNAVILTGVVDAPADWAYKVTMAVQDWTTILRTATSPEACDFLSTSVGIGKILAMGWWMTQFIVFLAAYRFIRLFMFFGNHKPGKSEKTNEKTQAVADPHRKAQSIAH